MKSTTVISRVHLTLTIIMLIVWLASSRLIASRLGNYFFNGQPLAELLLWDNDDPLAAAPPLAVKSANLDITLDLNDPTMFDRLGTFLSKADRVIISCPQERRPIWAMMLKGANIRGEVLAPELTDIGAVNMGSYNGVPTLAVSTGPLDTRNRAIKRGLDMAMAFAAIVALLPLMVIVAIAIKVDDGGPIFFIQPRLGRSNRLFSMYKFRSMKAETCDGNGNQSTKRDDVRITRVGKLIRSTSIDELPQILNVLKGDMSLVGPRPHALGSLAGEKLFWEIDTRYWHRHAIKPGITGLAQVRGFRGTTHLQSDLVNRLQADLEYISGWTWWRDISILFATLKVVLHRNAY